MFNYFRYVCTVKSELKLKRKIPPFNETVEIFAYSDILDIKIEY